jgi:hypothetical protein
MSLKGNAGTCQVPCNGIGRAQPWKAVYIFPTFLIGHLFWAQFFTFPYAYRLILSEFEIQREWSPQNFNVGPQGVSERIIFIVHRHV